ncbi:hypothetical protein J6590_020046 [Homalodisca vitripennis]|nr:hypothetical protein J6590_020046 [Homalodisca vitripennis]
MSYGTTLRDYCRQFLSASPGRRGPCQYCHPAWFLPPLWGDAAAGEMPRDPHWVKHRLCLSNPKTSIFGMSEQESRMASSMAFIAKKPKPQADLGPLLGCHELTTPFSVRLPSYSRRLSEGPDQPEI